MDRYYKRSELRANVLRLWRDYEAEALAETSPCLNGDCDAEIADYVLGLYLYAQQDSFCKHPELRQGIELRCNNRDDAEYMAQVMQQFTQDTIPYKVTWMDGASP
jgi:hypothetical protein